MIHLLTSWVKKTLPNDDERVNVDEELRKTGGHHES